MKKPLFFSLLCLFLIPCIFLLLSYFNAPKVTSLASKATYHFKLTQDAYPFASTFYNITPEHNFPGYRWSKVICNGQLINSRGTVVRVARNKSLYCSVTTGSVTQYKSSLVAGLDSLYIHWSSKDVKCSLSSTGFSCTASSTVKIACRGTVKNSDQINLGQWSIKHKKSVAAESKHALFDFGSLSVTPNNV